MREDDCRAGFDDRPSDADGRPVEWDQVGRGIGSIGHPVAVCGGSNDRVNLYMWCNTWQSNASPRHRPWRYLADRRGNRRHAAAGLSRSASGQAGSVAQRLADGFQVVDACGWLAAADAVPELRRPGRQQHGA